MSETLKAKWLDWLCWTILIVNLLRQIVNFIGVAMAGHYYIHDIREALQCVASDDSFSYHIVMHWTHQMLSDMSREAILNLCFAIIIIALFACLKRKYVK